MSGVKQSETSTMKTEVATDPRAFVTLRFVGDELDPGEISAVLPVAPTRAHRKGEEFFAGPDAGYLCGRTGIWVLATDKRVPSDDLWEHLAFLQQLLSAQSGADRRITRLQEILKRTHSAAHFTCFWRGSPGERPPQIPDWFTSVIAPLAANIETDFVIETPRRVR
jgi:Domain of unknown function (DUF4279)